MSSHDNKAIYRRFIEEVVNGGNFALANELLADNVIEYEKLPAGLSPDGEGIKQLFTLLRTGFPDLNITIEDQIAEGDKVVARVTLRGTHTGDFLGMPATGREIAYEAIDISRIVDGRLTEHWGIPDYLTLFQQLGITSTESFAAS